MSISVTNHVNISQAALKFLVQEEIVDNEPAREWQTNGEVLSNADYAWISSGARLQVIHTKTGNKVGSWTFGWILKDSNTEIICVREIQKPNGGLPLLAIAIDCDFSGGMICIFDFMTSKVVRAIQIKSKITSLHVIDAGYDVFTLPGPLRNFDGIIAVGTAGGDVYLVDICRQICDEALTVGGLNDIRDELNPSLLLNITSRDLERIEHHKEFAVRNSQHLAIHLNVVFDKSTKHFTLKGPKGDDRIHVNKHEVAVSALYYCPQLGSLLVGYNFGALQLYNLMNLELVYTSPVWEEHIPISDFSIQEPADDPKAVCYIWAIYSTEEQRSCLPMAIMYAFCYQTKEYHEGYCCLYQDFINASIQYQMELGIPFEHHSTSKPRGGNCLKIKSIYHGLSNREGLHHESNEDNFTLCVFVWNVRFSNKQTETFLAIFDLNQWYKEQMPSVPNSEYYSTYLLQLCPNDLINSATNKSAPLLDIHLVENSIQQFRGAQRLEEHFYPNSITFGIVCLRESDTIFLRNYGVQKALLVEIESMGPLCLVEPALIYQEIVGLGLVPLFVDLPINAPITTNQQREIILGAALENHLIGWLCKCASEWANGSFLSAGCSLDFLIMWAFQRAVTLKSNCDNFCTSLFDYSGIRLDNNTNMLLNHCRRQLTNLCSLYAFIIQKFWNFISNHALVEEQFKSLETGCVYFKVLQWLLNVGLLPECPISSYPRSDDVDRISAPYPSEILAEFYNHRRALLKILNEENFSSSESVLFIDALIERECGGNILQEEWHSDGGNGLYPPPSLQALLRTYLIDDVNLFYKHSVIMYVFLDLAMTLDQEKYKLVITHLIKFPAVFNVSPSVIKITQGFWQLDHCDFNTAMSLLLDPLVSPKDLTQWHHTIVLRALMLQKQHNYALYYMQVRKPVLNEDGDVLTAISLYVANNMIDEAFYFVKHFNSHKQELLLFHLFNECKKNEKLRSLIYRSLNSSDEKAFLKYLTKNNELVAEDLHVYYHILRSHFIEAFETHERTVPNQIENQGLLGQENAIPRDKLVSSLKKLLLGFSHGISDISHKEYRSIWQQVPKPTAMPVVVQSFPEKVRYKSTAIASDFGKALQKFEMDTQRTPFTPNASSNRTLLITPRVLDVHSEMTDSSPPASKRMKVSPRLSTSLSISIPSKLETPLVKRKTPKARDSNEERKITTPHSILKVKNFISDTRSQKDGEFEDNFNEFEKLEYTPVNTKVKKSGLGLSPRKPLLKSSPVVRFEGLKNTSSNSLNDTRSSLRSPQKLSLSPIKSNDLSSKNSSTEDEIFYSPESSLEKEQAHKETAVSRGENQTIEVEASTSQKLSVLQDPNENAETKPTSSPSYSPKGRRSYRRTIQVTPVRSSPRLSRNSNLTKESLESPLNVSEEPEVPSTLEKLPEEKPESTSESPKGSPAKSKLRPRKSLCRQVLETNTISRALNSPLESPRSRRSKSSVTTVEKTTKVVLESAVKYEDGEEKQHSSLIRKHNLTASFVEADLNSSSFSECSIQYSNVEGPILSDSIREYLNNSEKGVSTVKEFSSSEVSKKGLDVSESGSNEEHAESTVLEDIESVTNKEDIVRPAENENTANKSAQLSNVLQETNDSLDVSSRDKSIRSVLDSTAGEVLSLSSYDSAAPKLSKSMVDYIKGRNNESEDEVMEVDDYVEPEKPKVEKDKKINEEKVYTTLTTSIPTEAEKRDTTMELVYEKKNKEKENVDVSIGSSASDRPLDPEMNNFEISDDLRFNDGILVESEVTLEENDLCYGQQSTLENVLEDNIATPSSLNVLEKNVYNESFESADNIATSSPLNVLEKNVYDDSDESEESDEKKPHVASKDQDIDKNNGEENEVIEIGSSSEESDSKEEDSSRSDTDSSSSSSDYENNDQDYTSQRKIFESDSFSSNYRFSHKFQRNEDIKEISESSDEELEEAKEGCGLFEGNIIFEGDNENTVEPSQKKEDFEKTDVDQRTVEPQDEIDQIYEDLDEEEPYKNKPDKEVEYASSCGVEIVEWHDKSEASVDMDELSYSIVEDTTEPQHADLVEASTNMEQCVEGHVETQVVEEYPAEEQITEQVQNPVPQNDTDNNQNTNSAEVTSSKEDPVENEDECLEDIETTSSGETQAKDLKSVPDEGIKPTGQIANEMNEEEVEQDELETQAKDLKSLPDEGIKPTSQIANEMDKEEVEQDELETLTCPTKVKKDELEQDELEFLTYSGHSAEISKSTSTSSKRTKQTKGKKEVETKKEASRSRTKRTISGKSEQSPEKNTTKDPEPASKPARILRPRRNTTDAAPSRIASLRKRSASVDEVQSDTSETTEKELVSNSQKSRSLRSTSVVNLPSIAEEKKTENLEDFIVQRRVTRQQVTLLEKAEKAVHMLPVVVLDRMPVTKSDGNESSSPVKARRTRSASQPVEIRRRSKSKTPVQSVKSTSKKESTDKERHVAKPNTSKATVHEQTEHKEEVTPSPRATRSRTRSMSSNYSDDSLASDTSQFGRRRRKVLPQIPEETVSEKSVVPKKRTRQHSSQI